MATAQGLGSGDKRSAKTHLFTKKHKGILVNTLPHDFRQIRAILYLCHNRRQFAGKQHLLAIVLQLIRQLSRPANWEILKLIKVFQYRRNVGKIQ